MGCKINNDTFYRIKSLIDQVTEANPDIKRDEAIKAVNKMLPEKLRISPATYSIIKKSPDYESYQRIRKTYYENKKRHKQEEKIAQGQFDSEETEVHDESPVVEDDIAEMLLNPINKSEFSEPSVEEHEDNLLESLFEKYFLIKSDGYDPKTIGQQLTCVLIAINVLKNEFHKEYTGQNNEQTFGKKTLGYLSMIADEFPLLADQLIQSNKKRDEIIWNQNRMIQNQERIALKFDILIDLMSQSAQASTGLLAAWYGEDKKVDEPETAPAEDNKEA